jgi:hypothetical protein
MKTAISLADDRYAEARAFAQQLDTSRSSL